MTSSFSTSELTTVAALWRSTGRQIVTSFQGSSMLPTIPAGVEVTVECGRRWSLGDVVLFVAADQVFVHRVVLAAQDGETIVTRGDRYALPDELIEHASDVVIGVVTKLRRGDEWVDIPPAPDSRRRRILLRLCHRALLVNVAACRRLIHLIRVLTAAATIRSGGLKQLARAALPRW